MFSLMSQQWSWVSGSTQQNQFAYMSYGVKGVANSSNCPGPRLGMAFAFEASGARLWMLGGAGWTELYNVGAGPGNFAGVTTGRCRPELIPLAQMCGLSMFEVASGLGLR